MNNEEVVALLTEIRNWIRAASYGSVRSLLETALPDLKSRMAYQMMDGILSVEQIRVACKMSPNGVVALASRCTAMGLMESRSDKKRVRIFDLTDLGLLDQAQLSEDREKK